MSVQAAFRALLPHIPADIRAELISECSEADAINTLNLSKVEDPVNMRWLTAKRLAHSQGLSEGIIASLQRKVNFLDQSLRSESEPSIWLGYIVRNDVREVFFVDINRSAVFAVSEQIPPSGSD